MSDFGPADKFYLRNWVADLKVHFPFLDENSLEHPYRFFYYVWKLSYLFGKRYSDYCLSFEELIADPRKRIAELLEALEVSAYNLATIERLFVNPGVGKWRQYADDPWFRRHEEICEETLADWMGQQNAYGRRRGTIDACHS